MNTVDGYLPSQFSQQTLDLQKDFCCSDTDKRKLIRWVGCKPGVYRGMKSLFSSDDLAMCNWYQEIDNYQYITILLDPGETSSVILNSSYIYGKAVWPSDALNSMKTIELGINGQAGVIGSTIPFFIETPDPPVYTYHYIKDVFTWNTSPTSPLTAPLLVNNPSPYIVALSLMYAN
jgi:hypothetical protein